MKDIYLKSKQFFERAKSFVSILGAEFTKVKLEILGFSGLTKAFWLLLAIYALALSSLIRADILYIDDIGRKLEGFMGWINFSRYLSCIFSIFVHTDLYLSDIAPLTQIIAVFFIVLASLIVIMALKREKKITYWDVIAIIPLGLSPYFLECFSFRYDSPYMALSVLASIAPILFIDSKPFIYVSSIILGILISCTTYQASLGIFPMLVLFVVYKKWQDGLPAKDALKKVFVSAIPYLGALLFFKFMLFYDHKQYISTEMYPLRELPSGILNNLQIYYKVIASDFEYKYRISFGLLLASFLLQALRYKNHPVGKNSIVTLILLFLLSILPFGVYIVLKDNAIAPRMMYGFGVCVSLLAVFSVNSPRALNSKVAITIISWCLFVFSFTYGNALKEMDRYMKFRMESAIVTLNSIETFNGSEEKDLQLIGGYIVSPAIKNMSQNKYVLRRLLFSNYCKVYDWSWETYYFCKFYGLKNINGIWYKDRIDLSKKNLPLIKETHYEKIYHADNDWVVELK